MRRLLALTLALSLLAGALVGGAVYAERRALSELQARGVKYESLTRDRWERRFHKVEWRGLRAEQVQLSLQDPYHITVSEIDLDLSALSDAGGPPEVGAALADAPGFLQERLVHWAETAVVDIRDLDLRWGDREIAQDLAGSFKGGAVNLDGEGASFRSPGPGGEELWISLERELDLGVLSGPLSLEIGRGEVWTLSVSSPALVVRHERLATQPLKVKDVALSLEGDPASLSGVLSADGVRVNLSLACEGFPPSRCSVAAELPDTPADVALRPLSPVLPELRRAEVRGTVGGSLTYQWPEGTWTVAPRIERLAVEGAAPVLEDLRGGKFTYLVTNADGERVTRTTGEGTRDWTPSTQIAEVMSLAVMAAEDISFRTHPGFELTAIQEALDEAAETGELGRGGSTITQQLVKNLFLDGHERTIARKLRELLIAVEVDRELGKRRVMELYLNIVEWGPNLYGIRAASDYYFLKRPINLAPNEAAFLAALLPGPRTYHDLWYLSGRGSEARVSAILTNMSNVKWMTPEESARWIKAPLRFVPPAK